MAFGIRLNLNNCPPYLFLLVVNDFVIVFIFFFFIFYTISKLWLLENGAHL